jgi:hypothetical protein
VRLELADLDQVQAERLDLGQHAVQRRPVQQAGQHGVGAAGLWYQRRERRQQRGPEVAADLDHVPGGRWVHEAMVGSRQVNPHHQDQVTVLPRGAAANSRSSAPRGAVTGLQLGVDVPDVRPRGRGNPMLTSPVVIQTAARLGITPARVALLWLLQLAPNVLLIPGTGAAAHLRETWPPNA